MSYSLLATRYSLLATRYSLLATRYSLLATRYSLLATRYSLLLAFFKLLGSALVVEKRSEEGRGRISGQTEQATGNAGGILSEVW